MGASQYISCKGNINMIKPLIKFSLIVIIAHILTYYFAGIIAQLALGAAEFYPPSPNAISYLKDPHDIGLQLWLLPTQALRGLFFDMREECSICWVVGDVLSSPKNKLLTSQNKTYRISPRNGKTVRITY